MKARISEGYEPRWDVDLEFGKRGEEFVTEFLGALLHDRPSHITTEAKRDRQWLQSGNLWIEVACRRRDGWHDSGIRTSTADWWTLVLADCVILGLPTRTLRAVIEDLWDWTDSYGKHHFRSEEKDGSHPTKGVKVPTDYFLRRLRMQLARELREAA